MNIFTLSKAPLYLLISLFLPTMAMAIDPPCLLYTSDAADEL